MTEVQTNEAEAWDIPMRSPYEEVGVNGTVHLYNGEIVLRKDTCQVSGTGAVEFSLLGGADTSFQVEIANSFGLSLDECILSIPELGCEAPALVLNHSSKLTATGSTGSAIGILQSHSLEVHAYKADGKPESVGRVRFHLLNYPYFLGSSLHEKVDENHHEWCGRALFQFGQFTVTLDQFRNIDQRLREAKASRAYVFTHIGLLQKTDGKLFPIDQARKVLDALYWFFSFTCGARSGCVLPVGLQRLNRVVWQEWGIPIIASARSNTTWFCKLQPKACLIIAEQFCDCWKDKDKQGWLRSAIGLYLASNHNSEGVELALANAQIALEMLTWVALMEENRLISEDGFEKLSAADKIRALLFWLQVPHTIPAKFDVLRQASRNLDAPDAVTRLRNLIIHPTKTNRAQRASYSDEAVYQAWQLNMWYIELALLKLIGYSGPYNNRTGNPKGRMFDIVPWAANTSSAPTLPSTPS